MLSADLTSLKLSTPLFELRRERMPNFCTMGFIYSDLMVPPLVQVNATYYGWKMALYIAGTMFVSIILTALILNASFALAGIIPESRKAIAEVTQFKMDYTFWMNLAAVAVVLVMLFFRKKHRQLQTDAQEPGMDHSGGIGIKRLIAYLCAVLLLAGLVSFIWTH